MIQLSQVTKSVKAVSAAGAENLVILHQVSLLIQPAATVAIVGPSGSGKSTLLGLMAGLDLPSSGRIFLGGRDICAMDEDQRAALRAEQVGFVFQSFQLLDSLTAVENVMLPLELRGALHAYARAVKILSRVGLGERLGHYPTQLSGGEQQRVAIARAFVAGPNILFADEPTGNLDNKTALQIIELLFEVNKEQGTTLILVTHDARLAERCSLRFTLEGGRLLE